MRNILFGGKMGDFIHGLILPKYLYDTTGEIFNIYIANTRWEVFASGIDTSYKELYPVIKKQPYVNDFKIHTGESIDIDVTGFREFSNLFTTSWNEFYIHNYIDSTIDIPFNYTWLDIKKDDTFKDLLLINRNYKPFSAPGVEDHYINYIKAFEGKVYFVCSYIDQYTSSPFNDVIPMLYLPYLEDMITAIASCKHFLGNLTATAAIATAVNTPRTVETHDPSLKLKYIYEMKNCNTLSCFGEL